MTHQHQADPRLTVVTDHGTIYRVCECGATQVVTASGLEQSWHACWRCSHEVKRKGAK